MRSIVLLLLLALSPVAVGQTWQLKGNILDDKAEPLTSATVVLLNPSDSIMQYFAVSGNNGQFEIKNIRSGNYLLQISLISYRTIYRRLVFPLPEGGELGTIIMIPRPVVMNEVLVSGERIPVRIKKDTIEYDARAFIVKPDGVAEDLLRKLPGLEIDRSGNIKAMGEDVKNVLVDGKEFFGNDPKVATRNLPADAINKVQLFDKKTDESQFTGIDDGERNQTLNLVLDENKKTGVFGDVLAGGGTGSHAEASAKIYRFTDKIQFAGLGMFNNINQFGFSLGDYIGFSGGMSALSSGAGITLHGNDNSFPVNFGQPVYGSGSNGAAGVNFSVAKAKNNRFFVSYLGNGSSSNQSEESLSRYFIPDATYSVNEKIGQTKRDSAHRLNLGWRKMIGDRQNIIMNGRASYTSASNPLNSTSDSYLNEMSINSMERNTNEMKSGLSADGDASYLLKINEGRSVLKVSGRAGYSGSNSDMRFLDRTEFLNPYTLIVNNQFFDQRSTKENLAGTVSFTQKITRQSFVDMSFTTGYSNEYINRKQGNVSSEMIPLDSLSPIFKKTERYLQPGLTWKIATAKSQISLALYSYIGGYNTFLKKTTDKLTNYFSISPRASLEYNYKSGRRLMIDYLSGITSSGAAQMVPVVNNINPLSLSFGNRELKPEYFHNSRITWWLFDQFSFTTLLATLDARYTKDKINYSIDVDKNLRQTIIPVNVKDDWNTRFDIDFSTPFRPLGIKIELAISEDYNRGRSIINGTENINNNLIHRISLTLDNRKKIRWDISTGSALTITDSKYSVEKSFNNVYQDLSWFSEVRYTPADRFNIMGSADITNYSARSFTTSRMIPLLGAEINWYVMKNLRGMITLKGFDLLNRNTGIERSSELNYLVDRKSAMIGRYFMISFKYRLNKTGDNKGGIDIKVKNR